MKLDLVQGSAEWLAKRRQCVTGTDAAIIMGVNPWKTKETLLKQKLDILSPDEINESMKEGNRLEPIARALFEKEHSAGRYKPSVHIHDEYPWAMCSTDGCTEFDDIILEIKCSKKLYEYLERDIIPVYYYPQVQWNLWVTGVPTAIYIAYWDGKLLCKHVFPDEKYMGNLIALAEEFYHQMTIPIFLQDFEKREDSKWQNAVFEYLDAKSIVTYKEKELEHCRQQLIQLSGGKEIYGCGIKLTKTSREGCIDYASIPELKGVDLEQYRKEKKEIWTIREM